MNGLRELPSSEIDEEAISGYADVDDIVRALPIVVKVTPVSLHEDTVAATGRAVARLRHNSLHMLEGFGNPEKEKLYNWEQGRIRKIVKRAKSGSSWDRALACYAPHVVELAQSTDSDLSEPNSVSAVAVFPPLVVEETPKDISRLQVSGLDLPSTRNNTRQMEDSPSRLTVMVSPFLALSTGKEAAQVAHATQLLHMRMEESSPAMLQEWVAEQFGFSLAYPTEEEWLDRIDAADIVVRDAGFTEIPAGVRTVCAFLR